MVRYGSAVALVLALGVLACAAAGQSARPPEAPPATGAEGVDPAARKLLDELEQAGEKHETVRADVEYVVEDPDLGDREARTGWVAFRKGRQGEPGREATPSKFRVSFATLQQGRGPKLSVKLDYGFDGHWLTIIRHRTKRVQRIQVAAEGEKVDPFQLGKGPFPLPFGQATAAVLERFRVSTRPVRPEEPKGTDYLKLIVRPQFQKEMNFKRLEVWLDSKTRLPAKIICLDYSDKITTVGFAKVQTHLKLDDSMFHMERPPGYLVSIEPLRRAAASPEGK